MYNINFIRKLSDTMRTYVYALGYVLAFMAFVGSISLLVVLVHTFSSQPELILLGLTIVVFVYMGISTAISSAKHRVEMEKFQEDRIASKLSRSLTE